MGLTTKEQNSLQEFYYIGGAYHCKLCNQIRSDSDAIVLHIITAHGEKVT